MSDKELMDALTVLARRAGWIERGQRIEITGDPRDDVPPLCLAFGKYREVRLCCTYMRNHRDADESDGHSWERAMVGKSACANNQGPSANAPLCERPTNHTGEHEATGADGARWTWGDASKHLGRECGTCGTTIEASGCACAPTVCGELPPGGVRGGMSCRLPIGHGLNHSAATPSGTDSTWTWRADPSAPRT